MEKKQIILILAAAGLGVAAYVVYKKTMVIDPAVTALSTQQAKVSRDLIMSRIF